MGRHRQCGDQHCKQRHKYGNTRTGPHTLVFQAAVYKYRLSWCSLPHPTIGREGHTCQGQGDFVVYSLFRGLRWFPQRHQRQFDARRVFSHERRKASIHFGSGFQFLAKLVAMAAVFGYGSWEHQRSFQREPHTRAVQAKVKKPDINDYFLVSTLIRPLIQKCKIVNSVPWGPHYGVKLTLNINIGSVVSRQLTGKISKRNRHNTNVLQGQSTQ